MFEFQNFFELFKKIKKPSLNSKRAFSLVELMISLGISSMVALAVSSASQTQLRTMKGFGQIMDVQDLRVLLASRLSKPSVCGNNLMPGGNRIQINRGNPSATNISLNALYYSDPSSPVMVARGQRIASTDRNIVVSGIYFNNVARLGTTNEYTAKIQVNFDSSRLVSPIPPITIPLSVRVDNSYRVQLCNESLAENFQGKIVEASPQLSFNGTDRDTVYSIDLARLNQDYRKIMLIVKCGAWDDSGNESVDVSFQFVDRSGNVTFSNQACHQNSSGDDESQSRANYDTNIFVFPKPSSNIRTLDIVFWKDSSNTHAWAWYKTLE